MKQSIYILVILGNLVVLGNPLKTRVTYEYVLSLFLIITLLYYVLCVPDPLWHQQPLLVLCLL